MQVQVVKSWLDATHAQWLHHHCGNQHACRDSLSILQSAMPKQTSSPFPWSWKSQLASETCLNYKCLHCETRHRRISAVPQLFNNYSSIHVRLDFILRPSSGNYCIAVVLLLFCWLHRFNICQRLIVLSIERLTLAQWLDCLLLARVRVKSIK